MMSSTGVTPKIWLSPTPTQNFSKFSSKNSSYPPSPPFLTITLPSSSPSHFQIFFTKNNFQLTFLNSFQRHPHHHIHFLIPLFMSYPSVPLSFHYDHDQRRSNFSHHHFLKLTFRHHHRILLTKYYPIAFFAISLAFNRTENKDLQFSFPCTLLHSLIQTDPTFTLYTLPTLQLPNGFSIASLATEK